MRINTEKGDQRVILLYGMYPYAEDYVVTQIDVEFLKS